MFNKSLKKKKVKLNYENGIMKITKLKKKKERYFKYY
jgi:HSP20 family molecular chaperone IbpA